MTDNRKKFEASSDLLSSFDKTLCAGKVDWLKLKQFLAQKPELAARITSRFPKTNVLHKIAEASGGETSHALALATAIFKAGHVPDIPVDNLGRAPLMTAMGGQLEAMHLFLDFGADPNHRDLNGQTALHLIGCPVDESYLEKVRLLLSRNANPAAADKCGNTPLHYVLNRVAGVKWSLNAELKHLDRRKQRRAPGFDFEGLVEKTKAFHEAQLAILASVEEALMARGADINARNKQGLSPQQAASNQTCLEMLTEAPVFEVASAVTSPCPPLSAFPKTETSLASALKNIPQQYLLPPASEEDLRALAAVFEDGLPEVVAELYRHHGGMKESYDNVSMPLKTPLKALADILEERQAENNQEDYYLPNDGLKYAILWSDNGENHAGIFLKAPMAGRIYISDSVETFPVPAFRNVASFYYWLTIAHHYTDYYARCLRDYPSMRLEDEDPADGETSRKLIAQWESGGRTDISPIMFALYLSPCEDNDRWTDILESIIYNSNCDIQFGLGWDLCDMLGRRHYEPAVDALYMAALHGTGNMQSSAVFALKEMGCQTSHWALNQIMNRSRSTEVQALNMTF